MMMTLVADWLSNLLAAAGRRTRALLGEPAHGDPLHESQCPACGATTSERKPHGCSGLPHEA